MSLQRRAIFKQPAIYAGIICSGYLIDIAAYLLLVAAGVHLYVAYFLSFVVGATLNVFLLRQFFARARYSFFRDLGLTLLSNGVVILFAFALYVFALTVLVMPHLAAKVLSNALSVAVNYYTRRRYF